MVTFLVNLNVPQQHMHSSQEFHKPYYSVLITRLMVQLMELTSQIDIPAQICRFIKARHTLWLLKPLNRCTQSELPPPSVERHILSVMYGTVWVLSPYRTLYLISIHFHVLS